MTKRDFLSRLYDNLYFFDEEERIQTVKDYEEIIEEKIADGQSLEQAMANMTNPKTIAMQYAEELDIKFSTVDKYKDNLNPKNIIKSINENEEEVENKEEKLNESQEDDFNLVEFIRNGMISIFNFLKKVFTILMFYFKKIFKTFKKIFVFTFYYGLKFLVMLTIILSIVFIILLFMFVKFEVNDTNIKIALSLISISAATIIYIPASLIIKKIKRKFDIYESTI